MELSADFIPPSKIINLAAVRSSMLAIRSIQLSSTQKIAIISVTVGAGLLGILARLFRRRQYPHRTTVTIKGQTSRKSRGSQNIRSQSITDSYTSRRSVSPGQWSSQRPLMRQNSISAASSVSTVTTIVGNDVQQLTPQQLGLMGMEALETAVGYWEDALASYTSSACTRNTLTTAEEARFSDELQHILELSYELQDISEHLFLHEDSVIFSRSLNPSLAGDIDKRTILSVSSPDSFVSAQDQVADLQDFEEFPELLSLSEIEDFPLYQLALRHLEEHGVQARSIRTEMVHCTSDVEYLAKVHCIRLSFQYLLKEEVHRKWFTEAGRKVLVGLLIKGDKNPREFIVAYDDMIDFVQKQENRVQMEHELRDRGLRAMTFFDIVLDYIFMDAFADLEDPPGSVVSVMHNRWLSSGFKETALSTVLWSILKAKRSVLKYSNGFSSHFYDIMEQVMPPIAWGFLGPDEHLKQLCEFFKSQITGFLKDIFSFHKARYTTIEHLAEDIIRSAHQRFHEVNTKLELDLLCNFDQ